MIINVFIYSNIHLIIALALIHDRVKNFQKNLIINLHISDLVLENINRALGSGNYDLLLKRKNINLNISVFRSPAANSNMSEKIKGILINFLNFRHYKSDIVIVPNFSNLYILFCLMRIKHNEIIYIDEGMSYVSFLRYLKNNQKSKSYFLMRFFSKYASPYSIPKKIKSFVFNKEKFNQIKNISHYNFNLSELNKIFCGFIRDLNCLKNQYRNDEYTFVVTSPLSDRRYTTYQNEEFDILYKFLTSYVESNPLKKIIIKTHYRETSSKYKGLLEISKSISIYKGYLAFQELLILYQNADIICFHSSAVFSMINLDLTKNIYCLCDLIKTPSMKTISNALKELNSESVIFVK